MKALSGNPEARKMLKASREPANPEEAAALYAEIAEKNGISVTKETIRQLLEAKEKAQQTATAQAESAVKQTLDEDSLEGVAGGTNGGWGTLGTTLFVPSRSLPFTFPEEYAIYSPMICRNK